MFQSKLGNITPHGLDWHMLDFGHDVPGGCSPVTSSCVAMPGEGLLAGIKSITQPQLQPREIQARLRRLFVTHTTTKDRRACRTERPFQEKHNGVLGEDGFVLVLACTVQC